MANENIETQGNINKQDAEIVKGFMQSLGAGIAFLVHAGVEVGNHCRETFVKIAEAKPEVATRMVSAFETLEGARITTEQKVNELSAAIMTHFIDGCFKLAEKVVEKVDVNQLISHGIQHDLVIQQARMKEAEAELIKAQAKAKVAETEAMARLLEAQNEAKREERYASERRVN